MGSVRPISRMLISLDVGDLGQEVRRLFDELARRRPERRHLISGECMPLQDVFETLDGELQLRGAGALLQQGLQSRRLRLQFRNLCR